MSFACPVGDQRLVLDQVVRMPELAKSNRFAEASVDTVDALLHAAAEFAEGELAPHAADWDEKKVSERSRRWRRTGPRS